MYAIHYFENNSPALSQCLRRIPEVDENIKIKGRKGKVVNIAQIAEDKYHVHLVLEKLVKKETLLLDDKKKKR
ncbi:hypothetical protein DCE79_05885 [Lysinibacillus sp. 2017]|uniref:hypothetical protein n=1 Tax=unclassified Lysinibacillus TaxID=2636778 RepID=UPI000D526625|nr:MULTISPECIES: hypothetical protein [unclassified Lysinibacillus]AWE06957.1 hypothetical protein DCE79_05885 [Lysinibacillus sp. 2017]TGN37118.1 hypothetical protein E4L99_01120 [Lysinibacillus sp. S2017]